MSLTCRGRSIPNMTLNIKHFETKGTGWSSTINLQFVRHGLQNGHDNVHDFLNGGVALCWSTTHLVSMEVPSDPLQRCAPVVKLQFGRWSSAPVGLAQRIFSC